jgi:oxygen-independent coproporphyrinogen-3 oxidase
VERVPFKAATDYDLDDLAAQPIGRFVELGLLSDDGVRVKLTREGLFLSDALWPDLL